MKAVFLFTSNSKKARDLIASDTHVSDRIEGAYKGTPSKQKIQSERWIFDNMYYNDPFAYDFHIRSATTFSYSCAWYTMNRKSGRKVYRLVTKDTSYTIEIV